MYAYMQIQVARIQHRVPEYGWTTQKVFQFLNFLVNGGTLFSLNWGQTCMLIYIPCNANFTLLLICSKVFHLCFPPPSAPSEPSGLDTFIIFCHSNEIFNLIDQSFISCLFISDLSACYSWSAGACILHYLRNVGTFLGWNILSSTWSRHWWP